MPMLAVAIMLVVAINVSEIASDEHDCRGYYEHDCEVWYQCYGHGCYDDHMQLVCNMPVQKLSSGCRKAGFIFGWQLMM